MIAKNKTSVLPTATYHQDQPYPSQHYESILVAESRYLSNPSVAIDGDISDQAWDTPSFAEHTPSSNYQTLDGFHADNASLPISSQVDSTSTQSGAPYVSSFQANNSMQDMTPIDRLRASTSLNQRLYIDSHPQARQLPPARPQNLATVSHALSDHHRHTTQHRHHRQRRQYPRTLTHSSPSAIASSAASRPSSTSSTSTVELEAIIHYGDEYLSIGTQFHHSNREAYQQTLALEDEDGAKSGVFPERPAA